MKIKRSRLIEVKTKSTGAAVAGDKLSFPNKQELQYVKIRGFETYNDVDLKTTTNGGTVLTALQGRQVILFFKVGTEDRLYAFPYQAANTALNSGLPRELTDFPINLSESYAKIVSVGDAIPANSAIAINFFFDELGDVVQPQMPRM